MKEIEFDKERLINWYDVHSKNYDDESFVQNDERYGGDKYRIELVSNTLSRLGVKKILDVGCGTSEPMLRFLKEGYDIRGFDLSPGMIEQSKIKLQKNGYSPELVEVGDILDDNYISKYNEKFDAVIVNGVIPYLKDDNKAHENISKLIKNDGYFICVYCNELFDLMTLNKFTMRFHVKNFIEPLSIDQVSKNQIISGLKSLLTMHNKPELTKSGGARDDIFITSHNPMTIGNKLREYNLVVEDILFYKFHAFPPLLKSLFSEVDNLFVNESRKYEIKFARDWRGYFLASTFIVVARKKIL